MNTWGDIRFSLENDNKLTLACHELTAVATNRPVGSHSTSLTPVCSWVFSTDTSEASTNIKTPLAILFNPAKMQYWPGGAQYTLFTCCLGTMFSRERTEMNCCYTKKLQFIGLLKTWNFPFVLKNVTEKRISPWITAKRVPTGSQAIHWMGSEYISWSNGFKHALY